MNIQTLQRKMIPRLVPMTPYEIYLQQVKATYDNIRYTRRGIAYTPAQFGGIFGQLEVMDDVIALQLVEFEII